MKGESFHLQRWFALSAKLEKLIQLGKDSEFTLSERQEMAFSEIVLNNEYGYNF